MALRSDEDVVRTISRRELRNDSGEILRALRDGEEFEVTSPARASASCG